MGSKGQLPLDFFKSVGILRMCSSYAYNCIVFIFVYFNTFVFNGIGAILLFAGVGSRVTGPRVTTLNNTHSRIQ